MEALSPVDREQLEAALGRLRVAVNTLDRDEPSRALAATGSAEDDLWRLRAEVLGCRRPSWAPPASLVADWFSDEDSIYDDYPDAAI